MPRRCARIIAPDQRANRDIEKAAIAAESSAAAMPGVNGSAPGRDDDKHSGETAGTSAAPPVDALAQKTASSLDRREQRRGG
jgi:hypothetical protein